MPGATGGSWPGAGGIAGLGIGAWAKVQAATSRKKKTAIRQRVRFIKELSRNRNLFGVHTVETQPGKSSEFAAHAGCKRIVQLQEDDPRNTEPGVNDAQQRSGCIQGLATGDTPLHGPGNLG